MRSPCVAAVAGCLLIQTGTAQPKAKPSPGDWTMYDHDLAATRYSPLTQITTKNAEHLTRAWTYSMRGEPRPGEPAGRGGFGGPGVGNEVTPIVVNGVMYVPALNASTGKIDPGFGKEGLLRR